MQIEPKTYTLKLEGYEGNIHSGQMVGGGFNAVLKSVYIGPIMEALNTHTFLISDTIEIE